MQKNVLIKQLKNGIIHISLKNNVQPFLIQDKREFYTLNLE